MGQRKEEKGDRGRGGGEGDAPNANSWIRIWSVTVCVLAKTAGKQLLWPFGNALQNVYCAGQCTTLQSGSA